MLNSKYLTEIDGCLSTGKEANVYYAKGSNNQEYAVKIFKTSILVFKDRDRYVTGEYRFRHGYCKSNPRKMVRTWAEKEMRNLKRIHTAGIACPEPHMLKQHVLVMDFLGQDGWCAPRLKDVDLTLPELDSCYRTICIYMRRMYHECNLVHGDLSEYNLLWHKGKPVVIDVSQSVEHAHPHANTFLLKDITNIVDFFTKRGASAVLSAFDLYQFVVVVDLAGLCPAATCTPTEPTDQPPPIDTTAVLEQAFDAFLKCSNGLYATNQKSSQQAVDEAVFLQSYIPTSLSDIAQPHVEKDRLQRGEREKAFETAIRAMLTEEVDMDVHVEGEGQGDEDQGGDQGGEGDVQGGPAEDDEHDDDASSSFSESDEKYRRRLPDATHNPEARQSAKEQRKEARRVTKLEAAEKRTKKMPKHLKKRAVKGGGAKK